MKKICSCCKEEKNLDDFYTSKCSLTGYRSYCKVCAKEKSRISHQTYYENMKAKHDEWMANHPEHKEYQNAYNKEYRLQPDFKERNKEYQKKYAQTEKGHAVLLIKTHRRRRRSRLLINDLTYDQLIMIKESQNNTCTICHKDFHEKFPYELDHIIPVSKSLPGDPGLTMGNVQLLCRGCNATKNNKLYMKFADDDINLAELGIGEYYSTLKELD